MDGNIEGSYYFTEEEEKGPRRYQRSAVGHRGWKKNPSLPNRLS